jgi:hypothetical protein
MCVHSPSGWCCRYYRDRMISAFSCNLLFLLARTLYFQQRSRCPRCMPFPSGFSFTPPSHTFSHSRTLVFLIAWRKTKVCVSAIALLPYYPSCNVGSSFFLQGPRTSSSLPAFLTLRCYEGENNSHTWLLVLLVQVAALFDFLPCHAWSLVGYSWRGKRMPSHAFYF